MMQVLLKPKYGFLTVADKFGNIVSLIQSNYRGMVQACVRPDSDSSCRQRRNVQSRSGARKCYAPAKEPFHTIILLS